MTSPEELANQVMAICASQKSGAMPQLVSALRSYGEEEYQRGREECLNEQKCKDCGCSYERCCCNPMREQEAEAEGFKRGMEEGKAYRLAVSEFGGEE